MRAHFIADLSAVCDAVFGCVRLSPVTQFYVFMMNGVFSLIVQILQKQPGSPSFRKLILSQKGGMITGIIHDCRAEGHPELIRKIRTRFLCKGRTGSEK